MTLKASVWRKRETIELLFVLLILDDKIVWGVDEAQRFKTKEDIVNAYPISLLLNKFNIFYSVEEG